MAVATDHDLDELAHIYWATVAHTPADALSATRGVSGACIDAAIAAARPHGAPTQSIVVEIAAANPAIGAERAWMWARGIDDPETAGGAMLSPGNRSRAQEGALGNPHNGIHADEISSARGHSTIPRLLANTGTPTSFVDRYVELYPTDALAHPNCSPEHLRDPLGKLWPQAAGNPTISRSDALEFIRNGETSLERLAASWNPELTDADILTLLDEEHERPERDRRLIATLEVVIRSRRWQHDPWGQHAISLRSERRMSALVAGALAELTDDQRAAIGNLLDSRFDGTVTDILAVAATF